LGHGNPPPVKQKIVLFVRFRTKGSWIWFPAGDGWTAAAGNLYMNHIQDLIIEEIRQPDLEGEYTVWAEKLPDSR
jgi:hypothetical protein